MSTLYVIVYPVQVILLCYAAGSSGSSEENNLSMSGSNDCPHTSRCSPITSRHCEIIEDGGSVDQQGLLVGYTGIAALHDAHHFPAHVDGWASGEAMVGVGGRGVQSCSHRRDAAGGKVGRLLLSTKAEDVARAALIRGGEADSWTIERQLCRGFEDRQVKPMNRAAAPDCDLSDLSQHVDCIQGGDTLRYPMGAGDVEGRTGLESKSCKGSRRVDSEK